MTITNGDAVTQVILPIAFTFQLNRTYDTYMDVFDCFFQIMKENEVILTSMYYRTDFEQGLSIILY